MAVCKSRFFKFYNLLRVSSDHIKVAGYRIWDRYKQPVISLALLADGNPNFRPNHFRRERAGCRLEFQFPIVKLLDYKTEEELATDPSPFALASLVQLRKIQAGADVQQRYQFKLAFIRELYSRDYPGAAVCWQRHSALKANRRIVHAPEDGSGTVQ